MNRPMLSRVSLANSGRLCAKPLPHNIWLKPRFCASVRQGSTLSLGPLHQPLRPVPGLPTVSNGENILQFVRNRVLNATHRSGIYRRPGGSYSSGGGGSRGPWQRFRDRINALPNNYIFWGIMGLNGAVFLSWNLAWVKYQSTRDGSSYIWMRQHFIASSENVAAGRWYTLLTSCFSHEDVMHIAFNGFTFYFMAPLVLSIIGNVSFLGLYLGSGILSNMAGIAWRNYTQPPAQARASGAHGASGAIYSVVSFFACLSPTSSFLFFGIIPVPAWAFVTGIFLFDGYSAINHKRAGTDTAGHIGGLLSGIGFFVAKRLRLL